MRVLVQRVSEAAVAVQGRTVGRIGRGFLLLVGIGAEDVTDGGASLIPLAAKVLNLRVFPTPREK